MHIAICDDTIADRKHLERLLKRESDRLLRDGYVLYTDSYGSNESLMQNPMLYDLFFIDMISEGGTGIQTAKLLIQAGVSAPIVLCSSSISYSAHELPNGQILVIDKPYETQKLTPILIKCLENSPKRPALELRGKYETRYLYEETITYAVPGKSYVTVHFTDGSTFEMLGAIEKLAYPLSHFPFFIFVHKNYIININEIASVSGHFAVLKNKERVPLYPFDRKGILSALNRQIDT